MWKWVIVSRASQLWRGISGHASPPHLPGLDSSLSYMLWTPGHLNFSRTTVVVVVVIIAITAIVIVITVSCCMPGAQASSLPLLTESSQPPQDMVSGWHDYPHYAEDAVGTKDATCQRPHSPEEAGSGLDTRSLPTGNPTFLLFICITQSSQNCHSGGVLS